MSAAAFVRSAVLTLGLLLAGCSGNPPVKAAADDCSAEIARLHAQLAAEVAERQRLVRVATSATRREDALRRQLEAMKAIERGILEREERVRSESR